MDRRSFLSTFVSGLGAPLLSDCDLLGPAHSARYRLTAHGSVSGRPARASTVFEANWNENSLSTVRWSESLRGEAIVWNIQPGKTLVALLRRVPNIEGPLSRGRYLAGFRGDLTPLLTPAQRDQAPRTSKSGELYEQFAHSTIRADVPRDDWPILITVADPHDIHSMQVVDPENAGDAKIDGFWLEVTDEPITTGIEQKLPWLADLQRADRSQYSRAPISNVPLWAKITLYDFKLER